MKIQSWLKSLQANLIYRLGGKPQWEVDKVLHALREDQHHKIEAGIDKFIQEHRPLLTKIIDPYLSDSPSRDITLFQVEISNHMFRNLCGPHEVDMVWELTLRTLRHEFKRVGLAGLSKKGWKKQEAFRPYGTF